MKNLFLTALLGVFFIGCQSKVTPEALPLLKGYWEIERVVFASGPDKEYTANENYDYFEISGQQGFRKKVMPQLDGTFQTNNISEKFTINEKEGRYYIHFATAYDQWTEEIVTLNEQELILKNSEDKVYHYKKAQAINVLDNEKATK